jgi:DNA-binding NtrC family response regulator
MILVADDDRSVREAIRAVLEFDGYVVREAGSTQAALEVAGEAGCELVISDVCMPGGGLELLREVRERAPGIPVIMMTGFDDLAIERVALESGAIALLHKPLRLQDVRAVVIATTGGVPNPW